MWKTLFNTKARYWRGGRRKATGPLAEFYQHPPPAPDTPYDQVEFLAIDLETSGLDPKTDEILSIGYLPILNGAIRLDGAAYHLIRPDRPVPEKTAVIHGLLDDHLETAPTLDAVLPEVLRALTGRVPVAHHARIEHLFLRAACSRFYGHPLEMRFADTLALERRSLSRRGQEVTEGGLRLSAVRERYGLPHYHAHNALTDALAAAELFLAQAAQASGREAVRVADLLV